MGVTLQISTTRIGHYAGDTIEGTVYMEVASATAEGCRAHELKLRLVGRVRTTVEYISAGATSSSNKAEDSDIILSQEAVLGSFRGHAAPGKHTFPFSLLLPPDLQPSTEEEGESGSCSVRYSLKARLHQTHGLGLPQPQVLGLGDPKTKLRLEILGRRWNVVPAMPTMVGPATNVVRSCCMARGTMTIGCRVDRLEVRNGGEIQLSTALKNDSSVVVRAMHIKIKQLTKWKASTLLGSQETSKKRTLVSIVVPAHELGGATPPAASFGSQGGQSGAYVAEAARGDVQQQLAAGVGPLHRISVPRSALLSLEIGNIQVRHWLSVKLETVGFNSPPKLSAAVHIRPPLMAFEASAGPFEQRPVGNVPYTATAVGIGARGTHMPPTGPQAATAMSYSNARPQQQLQAQWPR